MKETLIDKNVLKDIKKAEYTGPQRKRIVQALDTISKTPLKELKKTGKVKLISEKGSLYMYRIDTFQRLLFRDSEDKIIVYRIVDRRREKTVL